MSLGLYLKKLAKMLEISSFFVFKGNSVFQMIEQAELIRAFLQDMARWAELLGRHGELSQAKLFFPKAWAKIEQSQAKIRLKLNTTTHILQIMYHRVDFSTPQNTLYWKWRLVLDIFLQVHLLKTASLSFHEVK